MDRVTLSHDVTTEGCCALYTRWLPAGRAYVGDGRTWVMRCAGDAGVPTEQAEDARLLTGELITNAVLHSCSGADGLDLWLAIGPSLLRFACADSGGGTVPTRLAPGPAAVAGRGLMLVDRLATTWGVVPRSDERTVQIVWFTLTWARP